MHGHKPCHAAVPCEPQGHSQDQASSNILSSPPLSLLCKARYVNVSLRTAQSLQTVTHPKCPSKQPDRHFGHPRRARSPPAHAACADTQPPAGA